MICGDELRLPFGVIQCDLEKGHEEDHRHMQQLLGGLRPIYWPSRRQNMIDELSDLIQRRNSCR